MKSHEARTKILIFAKRLATAKKLVDTRFTSRNNVK